MGGGVEAKGERKRGRRVQKGVERVGGGGFEFKVGKGGWRRRRCVGGGGVGRGAGGMWGGGGVEFKVGKGGWRRRRRWCVCVCVCGGGGGRFA